MSCLTPSLPVRFAFRESASAAHAHTRTYGRQRPTAPTSSDPLCIFHMCMCLSYLYVSYVSVPGCSRRRAGRTTFALHLVIRAHTWLRLFTYTYSVGARVRVRMRLGVPVSMSEVRRLVPLPGKLPAASPSDRRARRDSACHGAGESRLASEICS